MHRCCDVLHSSRSRILSGGLWWLTVWGVAFVGVAASLWQVVATMVAMGHSKLPTAIQAALMQPNWPQGTRWLFAAWWLLHLFAGLGLAITVLEEEPPSVGFVVFAVIASFMFTTRRTAFSCSPRLLHPKSSDNYAGMGMARTMVVCPRFRGTRRRHLEIERWIVRHAP